MKAIIYARVSTVRQAEDELPLESQLEQCEKKAGELGADVVRRYVDGGVSGTKDSRKAFQEAIAYCETFSPDFLITWSTSRFVRNRFDAVMYKRRLEHAGVRMVYVSQNIDSNTDSGRLLEGILEVMDDHYSRQTAADTKRSMIRNAQQGFWNGGSAPFGFQPVAVDADGKRKRLAPNVAEAEIVTRIFELRFSGLGAKRIAEQLNDDQRLHRGKAWSKSSVLGVLRSEAVLGRVVFNRKDRKSGRDRPRDEWIVVDSHPPIIELENWERVQALVQADAPTSHQGSHRSTWAFTGLIQCGGCGSSMQIETAKGRTKRYSYYNCRTNQVRNGCTRKRIRADVLEEWLLEKVISEVLTTKNLLSVVAALEEAAGRWAIETRRRRITLSQQLAELKTRNNNLYDLLELHGKDAPNLGDLTRRLQANNTRMKAIDQELDAIENSRPPEVSVSKQQLQEIREFLADTIRTTQNNKKLRHFLQAYLRSVVIQGDGEVRIEYDPVALVRPTGSSAVLSKGMWLPGVSLLGTRHVTLRMPPGMLCGGSLGRVASGQGAA